MTKNNNLENNSSFIIFKTEDDTVSVDVRFEDETVWLTQEQMAVLFGKAKSTINEHIKNIYNENELEENNTIKKFGISEFQQKASNYYNLDVIISVGYRVKSIRGTQFRQWATKYKADTTYLENQIDRLVYELYGLTEEEIKIVEGE